MGEFVSLFLHSYGMGEGAGEWLRQSVVEAYNDDHLDITYITAEPSDTFLP